ncbi:fibronectin type III domain-containing protein [Acidipila sp. EB88]|nr:fibronectin type III domain-containing protein [Acidipila sp. EB88]
MAQGTHQWTESSASDWEKGSPRGLAIGDDGTLSPGFDIDTVAQLEAADVWAAANDSHGNAYVATGSPAQVVRIAPDGKKTVLFTTKDVSVQSLSLGPDGALYVATLPSAKVFRLDLAPASAARPLDESTATVVFDAATTEARPKYIWSMQWDATGRLYLATGAPAVIYRITGPALHGTAGTRPEVFFTSDEPHLRSMLFVPGGDLLAGSDGTGLVYRIQPDGKGTVLFEAQKREITALALGPQAQLYVAAVGEKGRLAGLPPLPAGGGAAPSASITVTVVQPGSTQSVNNNTTVPDGSELYLIPHDSAQAPRRLWAAHDDVIYGLRPTPDGLLVATGNRGRVYRLQDNGTFQDVAHAGAGEVIGFVDAPDHSVYLPAANNGKLLRMHLTAAPSPFLLSDVFDATMPSMWGRAEITAQGGPETYTFETRTGNIDNPARGWTEWQPFHPADATLGQPTGRFAQWRLTLKPGARIQQVVLNYLPANASPEIDEILVAPGTRVNAAAMQPGFPPQTTLTFASQGGNAVNLDNNSVATPLSAFKDKSSITVRWAAHDDNGDDLRFSVYYQGAEDTTWHLLKDKLTDRYLSFDAALLPDGPYRLRVVATDAPSHPAGASLEAERVSELFLVDTATPQVTALAAQRAGAMLHVTAAATDGRVPIARAEYSLDAGAWQYIEPVGRVSDAPREQYDFLIPLPAAGASGPHSLTLRAFDRNDNVGSAKVTAP